MSRILLIVNFLFFSAISFCFISNRIDQFSFKTLSLIYENVIYIIAISIILIIFSLITKADKTIKKLNVILSIISFIIIFAFYYDFNPN